MRNFLSISLLASILFANNLLGQEPSKPELAPCGTVPGLDPWLVEFQQKPALLQFRSDDTLFVATKIHLLAKDNGVGRFSPEKFLDAFCRLNTDFAPSKIRFFSKGEWDLLNKTAWYDHDDLTTGIQMMLQTDDPDAIDCYFVSDPAGNCGYNLPYGGVAMAHGCAGKDDHTWAHEIGHNLSLPHPFIGWEGKIYNFNNPTPLFLTYDYTHFHAQPDTIDPAPLDTALVEFADLSNCTVAADKFCDTRPDYLAYRWDCDAQNMSTVKQKDPAGNEFYSDGSYFMGYASDNCQNRFTNDEIAAMRANLQSVKTTYLSPGPVAEPITGKPELLYPIASETAANSGTWVRWTTVPNATKYLVQGSRVATFAIKDFEGVTSDTIFFTGSLPPNYNIYWRVRPFNSTYTCTEFSVREKFFTGDVVSVGQLAENQWFKLFPNLIEPGQQMILERKAEGEKQVFCRISDATGKPVWQSELKMPGNRVRLPFETFNVPAGIYWAFFEAGGKASVQKFIIK